MNSPMTSFVVAWLVAAALPSTAALAGHPAFSPAIAGIDGVAGVAGAAHRRPSAENGSGGSSGGSPGGTKEALRPVDQLRLQVLKRRKSKAARALRAAQKEMQAKRYAQARRLIVPLQKDPLFSDSAVGVLASSYVAEAQELFKAKQYGQARVDAQRAIGARLRLEEHFPYSPLSRGLPKDLAIAEVLIGDTHWAQKQWANAEASYESGFQRLATANALWLVRPATLERYGQACARKKGELCEAWIHRFFATFAKSSEESRALAANWPALADATRPHYSVGKVNQAYRAPDLDGVAFDAAFAEYLDEKYAASAKSFRKLLEDFPKSAQRYRARYWLAQALDHDKDPDGARKTFENLLHDSPFTYYGLLASMATGKGLDSFVEGAIPMATDADPYLLPQETLALRRAESLVAEQANDLAALELREIRARDGLSSPFLMYLASLNQTAENYSTSFQILGELIQRGYEGILSTYTLRLIFPAPFLDTIAEETTRLHIDPVLVLSLMKQESAFDRGAISSSGALGLMQLMPATASDTEPGIARADLLEGQANIRVGSRYLAKLLDRYDGNIIYALASYNAGPGAVDRWIKVANTSKAKRGMLEFIESIPYKETREYVASIVRNHYWYSRELKTEPRTLGYFWHTFGPREKPPTLTRAGIAQADAARSDDASGPAEQTVRRAKPVASPAPSTSSAIEVSVSPSPTGSEPAPSIPETPATAPLTAPSEAPSPPSAP